MVKDKEERKRRKEKKKGREERLSSKIHIRKGKHTDKGWKRSVNPRLEGTVWGEEGRIKNSGMRVQVF